MSKLCIASNCCALALVLSSVVCAQSITTGVITGIVTDPTGAGVPNATIDLTAIATNTTQTVHTGSQGDYRFAFIPPGTYKIQVTAAGFQTKAAAGIVVTAGQPTSANFQLTIAAAQQTVVVTESASVLQTQNADTSTTFNAQMVQNLPNPGGDITYLAQTAPGVVMNTQSGYGNFVADGMPATSNLFTINGAELQRSVPGYQ